MRVGRIQMIVAASCVLSAVVSHAAAPMSYTQNPSTSATLASGGQSCCNECDSGCDKHCHHGAGNRRGDNNRAPDWSNCNCNGSYKFPVPPLYTYHWPGRYSQQLMTDYHSPWRFPPLKPYTNEAPLPLGTSSVVPTSATTTIRGSESLSEKMIRYYSE